MELKAIKPELLDKLSCPQCWSSMAVTGNGELCCQAYGHTVPLQNGIPIFTPPPAGMVPSQKLERGPGLGTPWRQANWRFLEQQIARLAPQSIILDVGSGRADFADALQGRRTIALDIYPYPEVDVVCDLTLVNPFRSDSFDAILLMNVLEHVYDTHGLLGSLASLLKPGGVLLVAVPFMVKMHQTPVDFVRYTHFALERLGEEHGLAVEQLEGYYDPIFFLNEGLGNLKWAVLPFLPGFKRRLARVLMAGLMIFVDGLDSMIGKGHARPPAGIRNMAPTGYQVVYRKNLSNFS